MGTNILVGNEPEINSKDSQRPEVKNSDKVSSKDVRGLLHFQEDYSECKLILLHRGKEQWVEKGVLCFPVETFLRRMTPNIALF